jgi:hypothetical protein
LNFDEAAERYIAAHEAAWRNPKHRQQWRNTVVTYASPIVGKLDVAAIDTPHILDILEPIWHEKTQTASRLRGRLETVLDWCKVRQYRPGAAISLTWCHQYGWSTASESVSSLSQADATYICGLKLRIVMSSSMRQRRGLSVRRSLGAPEVRLKTSRSSDPKWVLLVIAAIGLRPAPTRGIVRATRSSARGCVLHPFSERHAVLVHFRLWWTSVVEPFLKWHPLQLLVPTKLLIIRISRRPLRATSSLSALARGEPAYDA